MNKTLIKGIIIGGIIFGSIGAFAASSYEALTATFPILINGTKWENDKPVLVVEGSTYLPLKAIGDVLGVKVSWNDTMRQVEIAKPSNDTQTTTAVKEETKQEEPKKEETKNVEPKVFKDNKGYIAISDLGLKSTYISDTFELAYNVKILKSFSMMSYTITFYDADGKRVAYGTSVLMSQTKGDEITASMYIEGDLSNAESLKVQIDSVL